MWLKGYKQREIQESLSVSSGFISKWTQIFTMLGVSALKLAYKGLGYLKHEKLPSRGDNPVKTLIK
jgi:putative transposase